jgi:hypothetical protein
MEQIELPIAGLSKENREKVNTRIWIVGDEQNSICKLIKDQGYQLRIFHDGSSFEGEISSKEVPDCDLIITDLPYEIDSFIKDIHAIPGMRDFPVIVLGEEIDKLADEEYFESMGAIYVGYYESEDFLLSKIADLASRYKSKKQ